MADPVRAGEEGLLGREDYRSPILGSADPPRVDPTWPAFLATENSPGGEGLLPVVAQLLDRPILLINAGTIPPFVGLHPQPPPTAAEPLGRWVPVLRHNRRFQYRPHVRGRARDLPPSTIILAHRTWHYTAVVPMAQAAAQQARARSPGWIPTGEQPPPPVLPPAQPAAQGTPTPGVLAAASAQAGPGTQEPPDYVRGLPNMGNTCAINAIVQAVLLPIVEEQSMATAAWDPGATTLLNALTGARTETGRDQRLQVSTALCEAVARGCRDTQYLERVGHRGRPGTAPRSGGGPAQMFGDPESADPGGAWSHQVGSQKKTSLQPPKLPFPVGGDPDRRLP